MPPPRAPPPSSAFTLPLPLAIPIPRHHNAQYHSVSSSFQQSPITVNMSTRTYASPLRSAPSSLLLCSHHHHHHHQNSQKSLLRQLPQQHQQIRHATFIKRPKRPYTFTQLVTLSDGSTYTQRTTSPAPTYRSARDTRNAPMWNPSSRRLLNVEQDEAGKLKRFREKFGKGFDLRTDSAGDAASDAAADADAKLVSQNPPSVNSLGQDGGGQGTTNTGAGGENLLSDASETPTATSEAERSTGTPLKKGQSVQDVLQEVVEDEEDPWADEEGGSVMDLITGARQGPRVSRKPGVMREKPSDKGSAKGNAKRVGKK